MTPPAGVGGSGLAIIVVNYGSHALLERNLTVVSGLVPDARVIVVDNYTSAVEREAVRTLCEERRWHALLLDENVGFGAGINRAVAVAPVGSARHLLLLNPDATIDLPSLDRLRHHVATRPMDLVSPLVVTPAGSTWFAGADLCLDRGEMRSWSARVGDADLALVQPWLSGACLMLTQELWDRIGGFDEDYFLYWEDVDFSRRAQLAGAELIVDRLAIAVHDEGGTHRGDTPSRAKSPVYYYYNTRNRLLYAAKHLAPREQRRWRRSAPAAACRILLQGGRRQFASPRRTVVPAVRGTYAGFRLMRGRAS